MWSVAREPTLVCGPVTGLTIHPNYYYQFNNGADGPIGEGAVITATSGPPGVTHGDVHRYRGACHALGSTAPSAAVLAAHPGADMAALGSAAPVCEDATLLDLINGLDESLQLACFWTLHGQGEACDCLGSIPEDTAGRYLRCRQAESDNFALYVAWMECQ
eukprot:SAG22_NODE_221_length_14781_cov_82.531490_5_plen_161_part_00